MFHCFTKRKSHWVFRHWHGPKMDFSRSLASRLYLLVARLVSRTVAGYRAYIAKEIGQKSQICHRELKMSRSDSVVALLAFFPLQLAHSLANSWSDDISQWNRLLPNRIHIVIGSPRAYMSRNRCAITWVSNYLNFRNWRPTWLVRQLPTSLALFPAVFQTYRKRYRHFRSKEVLIEHF